MISIRSQLIKLIRGKHIDAAHIEQALVLTGVYPSNKTWGEFLDKLLLWLGFLSIAFAVLFFIAFNWELLGRFAKFGMVEVLIAAAVAVYWKFTEHPVMSKVALLLATIFLGVLLALFGQTYQTGADPWQLFFNWALLMLPWAIVSRFSVIWLLWLALLNTAFVLHHQTFGGFFLYSSDESLMWSLFALNTVALIVWEFLATRWDWLDEHWGARLIATASGTFITGLAVNAIFDKGSGWSILVWLAFLTGLYMFYRHFKRDLFMLAGAALSGIVVVLSVFIQTSNSSGASLLISIVLLALGSGAAIWLGRIHKEWNDGE